MKFLFLEPFYNGSHKDFAQGLVSHSKYKIDLIMLPDRLSYPEIIPKVFHDDFLYKDQTELVESFDFSFKIIPNLPKSSAISLWPWNDLHGKT